MKWKNTKAGLSVAKDDLVSRLCFARKLAEDIMQSQGYREDNNGEWLGPRLHEIIDTATEGIKRHRGF